MTRMDQSSLRLIVLISSLAACYQAPVPEEKPARERPSTVRMPSTVSGQRRTPIVVAVHNVLPSVVNIQTEATMRRQNFDPWFGSFGSNRPYQTQSLGSGFVWTADGLIVTNAHVVEGASRIVVVFREGEQQQAQVIGVDPDSDLAVLKVNSRNLVAAPIGSSADLMIGEPVIAVGNPFGLSGSVTTGVVSATGRSVPSAEQGRTFTDFIQTDASINPGNSGGPLLNIEGKVIGINVAIYAQAQGIGFAIPVDRARKVIEDLRRYGEVHGVWIGVVTSTLTPEEARRRRIDSRSGALITRVFSASPADRAGLRPGDLITAVDSAPVESREAFSTLTSTSSVGKPLKLRVTRDGTTRSVSLAPVEPPANLGLTILESASGIQVAERSGSLLIAEITRGSRAGRIGLSAGDVIVAVNGATVRSSEELNQQLKRASDRSSIVLDIARGRFVYTLTFPMGPMEGPEGL